MCKSGRQFEVEVPENMWILGRNTISLQEGNSVSIFLARILEHYLYNIQ